MVVFITGITSGFGKAMACKLVGDGHRVYGTYRRECEKLQDVVYIKADVCSDSDVEQAVRDVVEAEGRIDVFIGNAGMGIGGPIEYTSLEDARRQMDVNWMGLVRCVHFVLPWMRKQHSGTIVCFSSIGGVMGLPYQGFYSASKFAIEGYAEALRLELAGTGINVVVIEPGDFSTGFTASRKSVELEIAKEDYPGYSASMQNIEHDEQSGLKPEYLAEKISRIIRKRNPKYNYVIASPVQKLSVVLKKTLPKRLNAWILSSYYSAGR